MTLGLVLLFGHITLMISAVVVAFGPPLMFRLARGAGDTARLRAIATPTVLGMAIPILFITGGVLGLATAINFGTNLLAPWLVIAYVLFGIAMINGIAVHAPYGRRVYEALRAAPDGPLTPAAAAVIDDPRERIVGLVDYVIIVALLFDMVVKPFS
jgi:hypothetical protein